ncbi:MAG TPA: methylated-DNA--[protein]-cysteine S-methyltransferase [Streptosporangiaceae bacterium]
MTLSWTVIETPLGQISAGCSATGVADVRFGPPPPGAPLAVADDAVVGNAVVGNAVSAAHDQLAEYFSGTRHGFDLALDWGTASSAARRVLSLLFETVGYGETISYGALARRLALRENGPEIPARAIGGIMGSNPIPVIVPCHRVVAADGLGGFSGGTGVEFKRWLLTFEGALPAMLDFGPPAYSGLLRDR